MKYLKLKEELKTLATEIKKLKSERKSHQFGYVPGLFAARYKARHKHIAYCMLRGRAYEQIEGKCHESPDMEFVNKIMEENNETLCA